MRNVARNAYSPPKALSSLAINGLHVLRTVADATAQTTNQEIALLPALIGSQWGPGTESGEH
jgi:hypothetical protein